MRGLLRLSLVVGLLVVWSALGLAQPRGRPRPPWDHPDYRAFRGVVNLAYQMAATRAGKFGGASSTLNTSLIAFWKLDEASGTRADSKGANNLTSVNNVGQAAGKISNAAAFTAASSMALTIADNTDLSMGDIDVSWGFWLYITSNVRGSALAKWCSTAANACLEYDFDYGETALQMTLIVGDSTSLGRAVASTFGNLSTATWYYIEGYHNPTTNLIGIAINDGAFNTTAWTTGVQDGTAGFALGRAGDYTGGLFLDGRVDEAAIWKKGLTAAEWTEAYNSGTGKTCCPF